jgi:hypothetical protein
MLFASAQGMPSGSWSRLLGRALGDRRVCLCAHRIAARRRATEVVPKLTIAPDVLDGLIECLLEARPSGHWLTVSFDDGYRDSAEYLLSRAGRYPQIEWLYFVCPEKTEQRIGYRWDLAEVLAAEGERVDLDRWLKEGREDEHARGALSEIARRPEFELADLSLCREIAALPNAELGNHSNTHQRLTSLGLDAFRRELDAGFATFERLFGRQRHFAFPFGIPGEDFWEEHVEALRARSSSLLWSTEPRPYRDEERLPGAVLPRFALDGTRSLPEQVVWIALHALRTSPRLSSGAGNGERATFFGR